MQNAEYTQPRFRPEVKKTITTWAYHKLTNRENVMYARQFSRTHKLKIITNMMYIPFWSKS